MATDKNALLWAIRGIDDTYALRIAVEELERVLNTVNATSPPYLKLSLELALDDATDALYRILGALPSDNQPLVREEDENFTMLG